MTTFSKKFTLFLLIFCLPLLFLPKINFISFAGETAGIRVDDLILLLFSGIFFWGYFSARKRVFKIEMWMLILFLYSLLSFCFNRLLFTLDILPFEAKIFYCFRFIEYFLFFYLGALFARYWPTSKMIYAFFLWNLLWMTLQKAGVIGAFGSQGYVAEASWRVQGITSFPNELAIVLNLLFCLLLFSDEKNSSLLKCLKPFWLFALFATLIILTGSRIALLGLTIPFMFKLKDLFQHDRKNTLVASILLLPIVIGTAGILLFNTEGIMTRGRLFSIENLDIVTAIWNQTDPNDMRWENVPLITNYDISWWMRLHKWCQALKLFLLHPECYLLGIGPGFASAALDGGILRIIVEYGIAGAALFGMVFWQLGKQNQQMKWVVIALLINMLFIDAHLAYKPMSLLFFMAGAFQLNEEALPVEATA